MDFGELLHVAKKNSENSKNSERKFYSTKFSAPKKLTKEKTLSDNIKKFLIKKEEEEREKARQEKAKLNNLLAQRDEKSKNKIRKMLKVTKSANKSVIFDAIDNEHTSVTLQGPDQPDEDDYGYVSNEAAAFFQKYVDKVGKLPDEKQAPIRSKTSFNGPKPDLVGAKERMRAAILQEQELKNLPKGARSSATSNSAIKSSVINSKISSSRRDLYDPQAERDLDEKRKREREDEVKKLKFKKPPPPPMDFKELLRLAEKKQFEPVPITKVEEKKEPERLLSKKEKMELEDREKRKNGISSIPKTVQNNKIPKLNSKPIEKSPYQSNANVARNEPIKKSDNLQKTSAPAPAPKTKTNTALTKNNGYSPLHPEMNSKRPLPQKSQIPSQTKSINTKPPGSLKPKQLLNGKNGSNVKTGPSNLNMSKSYCGPTREFPPKDLKRPPPPQNVKTREFPPRDIKRSKLEMNNKPVKRRIYDDYNDEDDDEYDSELDDFIEDDPEGEKNVSSYIKEIFGYDKAKYRDFDDDDRNMESNFAQQMREETISKKIGLMEDLEDMRKEAEAKKRKVLMQKRKFK